MPNTSGPMTVYGAPPSFVVADSTFELEIKDLGKIKDGKRIVSDKIQLMAFSDAAWTIRVHEDPEYEAVYFKVDFHNIPEELQKNLKKELLVSCKGETLKTDLLEDHGIVYMRSSVFANYVVNNSVALSFRLMITCEGASSFRKFLDPQAFKKSLLGSVANLLQDPTYADFTFIVCGKEFKVHMNILAAASPVMHRMFTGDLEESITKTCTTNAFTPEIFAQMLLFVYNADIPQDLGTIAMPLYEAAHYYDIENLKQICAREIYVSLSPVNALEVFEWVQPYDLREIKMEAWTIIKRDILKIFVKLKNEPLSLEKIKVIIKHREEEKKFWKEFEEEVVVEAEKTF